jgi:RNA polymerase sigma-70 factor (sigma-E family)
MTFDEFVRAELGALTRFAGALTGDRPLAEDLLSDTLVKVLTRWRRISSLDDPAGYVRRMVVTTYLSDRRKAQRRRTAPSGNLAALDSAGPDASVSVLAQDEIERLLQQLPRYQRAAVVLRYLLDQTDEQIAQVLGCSPATVRSHLSHARATLRLAATTPANKKE